MYYRQSDYSLVSGSSEEASTKSSIFLPHREHFAGKGPRVCECELDITEVSQP